MATDANTITRGAQDGSPALEALGRGKKRAHTDVDPASPSRDGAGAHKRGKKTSGSSEEEKLGVSATGEEREMEGSAEGQEHALRARLGLHARAKYVADPRRAGAMAGKRREGTVAADLGRVRAMHRKAYQAEREQERAGGGRDLGVQPFVFATSQRAIERARFDEMMREKEETMRRARERARAEAMAREESEVREMRRRMVPRANEVPSWYAEKPKRRRREAGDVRE